MNVKQSVLHNLQYLAGVITSEQKDTTGGQLKDL